MTNGLSPAPGSSAAVYTLQVGPVPRKLEGYFMRPQCLWLAVDFARVHEDGMPGQVRPLQIWAPPSAWQIPEDEKPLVQALVPFHNQHKAAIADARCRGMPVPDPLVPRIIEGLTRCHFVRAEIRPDLPAILQARAIYDLPRLLEPDGTPIATGALLLGPEDNIWAWVEGVIRPVRPGESPGPLPEALADEGPEEQAPEALQHTHPKVDPVPRLTLLEDNDRLVARLTFRYGEATPISPGDPRQAVPGQHEGRWGHWLRRPEREATLMERLLETALEPRMAGVFVAEDDAALDFLMDHAAKLLAEGWEIFGRERLRRLRVTEERTRVRVSVSTGIDWLEIRSDVMLGDQLLDELTLLEALKGRSRYVRLGDGSHARLPEEWLRQQRGLGPGTALTRRLPGYLATVVEDLLASADEADPDPRWLAFRERLVNRDELVAVPVPGGLDGELRPYQRRGLDFLSFLSDHGLHGILADDMGLGKTIQAISWILREHERGVTAPTLLVVPTSVIYNWERELERFAPNLKVLVLHGPGRRPFIARAPEHHVVITSYNLLRRDLGFLIDHKWHALILDEAHNIKNPHAQSAQAARTLQARHRLCLSGTPLENHPLELWSLFHFLMPGLLGTEREFRQATTGAAATGDTTRWERLRRRTSPYILRRLKRDVATDLPPRSEIVTWCELGDEQRRLYDQTLQLLRGGVLEAVERRGVGGAHLHILEALLRLRQICCAPALLGSEAVQDVPSAKVDALLELLGQAVAESHRVLVFSQFVRVLQLLRPRIEALGMATEYLDGQTRDRLERVERFNQGTTPVFLISLKAGGTGLNLTGADYVVHFDPWWNPAVEDQATDRAHRIGQTRHVFSYKLIARGTIEEKVLQLQARKRQMVQEVLSEGTISSSLTADDVRYLFEVEAR